MTADTVIFRHTAMHKCIRLVAPVLQHTRTDTQPTHTNTHTHTHVLMQHLRFCRIASTILKILKTILKTHLFQNTPAHCFLCPSQKETSKKKIVVSIQGVSDAPMYIWLPASRRHRVFFCLTFFLCLFFSLLFFPLKRVRGREY